MVGLKSLFNFKPESAVENYQECVEQERLNPWQFPSFRLSICKFSCKNEFYCNLLFSFSWVQVVFYVYLLLFNPWQFPSFRSPINKLSSKKELVLQFVVSFSVD